MPSIAEVETTYRPEKSPTELAINSIVIDKEGCVNCKVCEDICPEFSIFSITKEKDEKKDNDDDQGKEKEKSK